MSFIPGKPYVSWKHIEAKTPEELEMMILKISITSNYSVKFSEPSFSGNKWHVWFLFDWSNVVKGKEKLDLEKKGEL